ncbi:threonine aldolase family protein [Actinomadura harenae]|nr:low specificity L-threonine aldolase [Actinomadura harenae]
MSSSDVHHGFGSDNHAGIHPEVMTALAEANTGYQLAYGSDAWTERLDRVVERHFGPQASALPVFNGTGANVVALQAMCERWSSVICAESAHINQDECGASEHVGGLKLVPVPAENGKLTPEAVARRATGFGNVQRSQPAVVSISQVTEVGTVYTPDEIAALASCAHERGMSLHMDGARLANAAVSLDVPLRAITTDVGVDVLSFGGTKNGMMLGEMVVVLNQDAAHGTDYLRKSSMQLASKMRFLSAQFVALLDGDLWQRNARHANAMARLLADRVSEVAGVEIIRPVDANAVFARLPEKAAERLRERFFFHGDPSDEVRWMCAFDTTEADIDAFTAALRTSVD